MKCRKHPRYQGKGKPRCDCQPCWRIWYNEQLKDPRWQKRRLQIFERDKWKCIICGDSKKQLHVHHYAYKLDAPPWETPSQFLATVCQSCHGNLHKSAKVRKEERDRKLREQEEQAQNWKLARWQTLFDESHVGEFGDVEYPEEWDNDLDTHFDVRSAAEHVIGRIRPCFKRYLLAVGTNTVEDFDENGEEIVFQGFTLCFSRDWPYVETPMQVIQNEMICELEALLGERKAYCWYVLAGSDS